MSDKRSKGFTALSVIAATFMLCALIWPTVPLRLLTGALWGAVVVVGVWDE